MIRVAVNLAWELEFDERLAAPQLQPRSWSPDDLQMLSKSTSV